MKVGVVVRVRVVICEMACVAAGWVRVLEPGGFLHYVLESPQADIVHDLHHCSLDGSAILVEELEGEGGTSEALGEGYLLVVVLPQVVLMLDAHEAHHGLVCQGANDRIGEAKHQVHQVSLVVASPLEPDPKGHHVHRTHRVPPELDHEPGVERPVYVVKGVELLLGDHKRDP